MSSTALLPIEFHRTIQIPRSPSDPPEMYTNLIAEALGRRQPDLLELQGDCYELPIETVLFLYRRDPAAHCGLVLSSLGVPTSVGFCQRVAAVARDAWERQDWRVLGRLCHRLELAAAATRWPDWSSLANDAQAADAATASSVHVLISEVQLLADLRAAFMKVFAYERGIISAEGYVRAALEYLSVLPMHFVLPPDCCGDGRAPANDWPLLAMFCSRHAAAWHNVPEALEALRRLQHPQLLLVFERLSRPADCQPPRPRRLKNPFQPLAGKLAIEPRRRRPRPVPSPRGADHAS